MQTDKIVDSLMKVNVLKDLKQPQFLALAGAVQLVTYSPGDLIIEKGSQGNIFYMIKSGSVIISDADGGMKPQKIGAGEYFGEKALLTGEPRAANIRADTAITVMALDREDFNNILGDMRDLMQSNLNLRILSSVPVLNKLSDSELAAVAAQMSLNSYKKGDKVVVQGSTGTEFFIIKSGECIAQQAQESGTVKNLKKLRDGDFFGEMALLNNEPRVCDIVAISDTCDIYSLDRSVFDRILGSLSEIMKRTVSKRTKQNEKLAGGDNGTSLRDIPKSQLKEIAFLGTGTFGRVSLVQDKKTGEVMALKAMSKAQIVAHRQQINVMNEKNIMVQCNSPFILKLFNTYKDSQKVYLLMEFCQGGELFTVLHTAQRDGVPMKQAQFYAVCVMLGLQHMDSKEIAYRDLKPENALVDSDGYVKIIDMGFAKIVKNKTFTLCGTPEYLAPEIVLGRGHNRGVDHWAFGILCYEMIAGYSPFADLQGMDQVVICQNIVKGKLSFPKGFDSDCKELIKKLLVRDPCQRLGMTKGGVQAICDQKWFEEIDYAAFQERKVPAPWKPECKDPTDVSNFDPYDQEEYYDPNFKDGGDWDKDF
jgi:cGMP-dependent protein kinase